MNEPRRGDIVLVALPGDYGKPRPAVIVQSSRFDIHSSVTLLPLTSDLQPDVFFRVTVEPTPENGLKVQSQVMVDKILTHRREKLVSRIGKLDTQTLTIINQALILWLGLDELSPP